MKDALRVKRNLTRANWIGKDDIQMEDKFILLLEKWKWGNWWQKIKY